MWHEDLIYTPLLETAKKAMRANARFKELHMMGSGEFYGEVSSNNTATQSVSYPNLTGDPAKIFKFAGLVENVVSTCREHHSTGTMVVPKIPGMTMQTNYVNQLEAKNARLERRVDALESELKEFLPYIKTIRRMVDEYHAGTVRAQQMARDLQTSYQVSGAIERAAHKDLRVITEPIDWSVDES